MGVLVRDSAVGSFWESVAGYLLFSASEGDGVVWVCRCMRVVSSMEEDSAVLAKCLCVGGLQRLLWVGIR